MKKSTLNLFSGLLQDEVIAISKIGSSKKEFEYLAELGVVSFQLRGAGGVYILKDPQFLQNILNRECPVADVPEGVSPVASAVLTRKDAHKGRPQSADFVLLKAGVQKGEWSNGEESFHPADFSFGAVAPCISPEDKWITDKPLALLENKEPFVCSEQLRGAEKCGTFLYYAGWINSRVLSWLTEKSRAPRYIVYSDYDPVGMVNYLKLKESCTHTPVELFVPDDIEDLFKRFSNPERLTRNIAHYKRIRLSNDPAAVRIAALMQQYGGGLDQEILLV